MGFGIVIRCLGDGGVDGCTESVQLGAVERLFVVATRRSRACAEPSTATAALRGCGFCGAVQLGIDQVEVGVLQVAPIGVDLHLRRIEFLPDALADGGEQLGGGVGGSAVDSLLFHQSREALIVQHGVEHAALGVANAHQDAGGLDAAQNFGVDHPERSGERVIHQELRSFFLLILGTRVKMRPS